MIWRYVAVKLMLAVPTLVLVSILVFSLVRLVPGDTATILVGDTGDTRLIEEMRAKLGLNRPLLDQYFIWVGSLLQGDFGVSQMTGEAIGPAVLSRFLVTAQLAIPAFALAVAFALLAGMTAAWRQGSRFDAVISVIAVLCLSIPGFWLGMLMIYAFAVKLQWLPAVGVGGVTGGDTWKHLLLPVSTLAVIEFGVLTRIVRASTLEVIRQDYVVHAMAKGLRDRRVLWRHVFPNAFAPSLTMMGMIIGSLLGGAAVLETVFSLPGLGRFMVDAIYARDYQVLQAALLVVAAVYIVSNLATDLAYPLLDPRVRL